MAQYTVVVSFKVTRPGDYATSSDMEDVRQKVESLVSHPEFADGLDIMRLDMVPDSVTISVVGQAKPKVEG